MKLKNSIIAVICLFLIISLTACSKIDPNYGVKSKEKSTTEEKLNFDKDMKIMSDDRVMPNYVDISLFDEENYADIYLGKKFEIDAVFMGESFPVPTVLSEMAEKGWTLAEGNEYDEHSLVFAYETISIVLQNEKGIKVKAKCYNSSRSSVKLEKCNIVMFRIENDFYKNSKEYTPFNINGITNTMAITDIIDILGTPSHFYGVNSKSYYLDYFITKRDRRNGITIYVNPVEDSITAIEFSYYN